MPAQVELIIPGTGAVLLDGAMGTSLRAAGWQVGKDTLSANLEAPDIVAAVHAGFVEAGAEVLLTNTFAAPFAADVAGETPWRQAISEGVALAKRAARGAVKVGGCAGVSVPDAGGRLAEAVKVLAECGVDLLVLETVTRADDARRALEAALKHKLPVVLCASSTGRGEDEQERVREIGAVADEAGDRVIFGLNCCRGPADVLRIASALDRWPLWVKPNTGVRDHASVRQMAEFATEARERGSRFIGGCCGVNAEMLRAMGESLA